MDTVQKIKEKLSILEVVAPYVKLAKSGRNYKGLSPFNKEKTPSFYVNPERGTYYCFSSGQGGDQFEFIQKMEGVDFKGALKILAEKAGVEIVYSANKEDKGKQDKLFEAMSRAENQYVSLLDTKGPAYAYALSRGLSAESIKDWNIGYAPDTWRTLLESLEASGFTKQELSAAGLVKEADEKKGTWYDRFRNRLMFPIKDIAGRTVAFTGRALDPNDQAKYLNSPETDLYKKSEILFGMHKAKDAIRTRGFALLVEGQMDLLMLHQIGFTNTVALSGTALSPKHLTLVKRYADNLMLALDSDRAGLNASMKNALVALKSGMRVKAVLLPEGKDPADLATEDPKEFTKRVSEALPIIEFFLSVLAESEKDSHRLIIKAEQVVLPLIAAIQSPMEREHFVGIAAQRLGSTPEALRQVLARLPQEGVESTKVVTNQEVPKSEKVKPSVSLGLSIRALVAGYPETALAKRLKDAYARIIGAPFPDEPPPEQVIFEAGIAYGEAPDELAADELITVFEKTILTERLSDATVRLRVAEASQNKQEIQDASEACRSLAQALATFK
ncbi:DNA primase [Patescibacteria group bacterium]|nr:DNA primase [Patescibacteria group bacterium]